MHHSKLVRLFFGYAIVLGFSVVPIDAEAKCGGAVNCPDYTVAYGAIGYCNGTDENGQKNWVYARATYNSKRRLKTYGTMKQMRQYGCPSNYRIACMGYNKCFCTKRQRKSNRRSTPCTTNNAGGAPWKLDLKYREGFFKAGQGYCMGKGKGYKYVGKTYRPYWEIQNSCTGGMIPTCLGNTRGGMKQNFQKCFCSYSYRVCKAKGLKHKGDWKYFSIDPAKNPYQTGKKYAKSAPRSCCQPFYKYKTVGEAPFCCVGDCDCASNFGSEWTFDKKFNPGNCLSGKKVRCKAPGTPIK